MQAIRAIIRLTLGAVICMPPCAAVAEEVQHHGVVFEEWVRDTLFDGYRPETHTQKWDVSKEANVRYGGIPVNPKATKYGAPVGLGDALRQFDIDEPFLLLVAYWEQRGEEKQYVKALSIEIPPEKWRSLWGGVTRADLEALDRLVKDRSLDVAETRRRVQEMKSGPPYSTAAITLNPKIDEHGQRRLQCSLGFRALFEHLAPGADPAPESVPQLLGHPLPGPFHSLPRQW